MNYTPEERKKRKRREKIKKDIIEVLVVCGVLFLLAYGFHWFIIKMTFMRYPWFW